MTKSIKPHSDWARSQCANPVKVVRAYVRRFPNVTRAKAIATLSKKGIAVSTISTNRYLELQRMKKEGVI